MFKEKLTVRDLIARQKSEGHYTAAPTATVQEAARQMQHHFISAISVLEPDQRGLHFAGIVSEKDIAHLVARGGDPARTLVSEIMATDLITVGVETSLWETAKFMLDNNVRHLPVLKDGQPLTVISIRDVLGLMLEYLTSENIQLQAQLEWMGYRESVQ